MDGEASDDLWHNPPSQPQIMRGSFPSHKLVTFLLAETRNCYFELSCSDVLNLIKLTCSKTQFKTATPRLAQGKQHERKRLLLSVFFLCFFPLLMFIWHFFIQFNTSKHIYR